MENYNAFTTTSQRIVNKLTNEVILINGTNAIRAIALWDTGATNSCVSHEVVSLLNLTVVGLLTNHTPSGSAEQNAYIIDIVLPNQLTVHDVQVSESEIGNQGIDILIGMDIINLGDFSVSNYNGKTMFTFRIPSIKDADYVKDFDEQINN